MSPSEPPTFQRYFEVLVGDQKSNCRSRGTGERRCGTAVSCASRHHVRIFRTITRWARQFKEAFGWTGIELSLR